MQILQKGEMKFADLFEVSLDIYLILTFCWTTKIRRAA
jgi:hypothetical protein